VASRESSSSSLRLGRVLLTLHPFGHEFVGRRLRLGSFLAGYSRASEQSQNLKADFFGKYPLKWVKEKDESGNKCRALFLFSLI